MINGPQDTQNKPMADLSEPVYVKLNEAIQTSDFQQIKNILIQHPDINLNFYVIDSLGSQKYIATETNHIDYDSDGNDLFFFTGPVVRYKICHHYCPFLSYLITYPELYQDEEFIEKVIDNSSIDFTLTNESNETPFEEALLSHSPVLNGIIVNSSISLNAMNICRNFAEHRIDFSGPVLFYAMLYSPIENIQVLIENNIDINFKYNNMTCLDLYFSKIDVYHKFFVDMRACREIVREYLTQNILEKIYFLLKSGAFFSHYTREDAHRIIEHLQDKVPRHIRIIEGRPNINMNMTVEEGSFIGTYNLAGPLLDRIKEQLTPPKLTKSALRFTSMVQSDHGASSTEPTQSDASLTESLPTRVTATRTRKAF